MSEARPYTLAEVTPYEVQCIDSLRLHATVVALDASRAETRAQRERADDLSVNIAAAMARWTEEKERAEKAEARVAKLEKALRVAQECLRRYADEGWPAAWAKYGFGDGAGTRDEMIAAALEAE